MRVVRFNLQLQCHFWSLYVKCILTNSKNTREGLQSPNSACAPTVAVRAKVLRLKTTATSGGVQREVLDLKTSRA